MFRFLLLIALLPVIAFATEGLTPCKNGEPMPTKVDVENCDRVPCILPRGGSLTNIIDFENRKCVVVWVKRKDLS